MTDTVPCHWRLGSGALRAIVGRLDRTENRNEGGATADERSLVLLARFKSSLSRDEVKSIVEEPAPEFKALPGLKQKKDVNTGDVAGPYMWEFAAFLESFRGSSLRATIAEAYRCEGEPRVEIYRVFKTLHEEEP